MFMTPHECDDYRNLGFHTKAMFEFPNIVNVEVYRGRCACRCIHCPLGRTAQGERHARFGETRMPLELYSRLVQEAVQFPHTTIRIHAVGEPLFWHDLLPALRLTRMNNVRSWLFTSATLDAPELFRALCENADIVEVSVNSTTSDDYEATKGLPAFDLVCNNIALMRKFIQSEGMGTRLIVSRVQSADVNKDRDFAAFWKSTGSVDDAFIRSYHTYNDLLPPLTEEGRKSELEPCLVHWGRFNVSVQGLAIVCFNELFKERLDPALVLGNLWNESIGQIWYGPKLSALRNAALCHDYSALSFSDSLPCRSCRFCQPLSGTRPTSEFQVALTGATERRAAGSGD